MKKIAKWILISSFSFLVLIIVIIAISPGKTQEEPEKLTAEEMLQKKIEEQFSPWDGSHRNLVIQTKNSMRDPKSFEHIETRYGINEEKGTLTLVMTFRGANAFGGKVIETAHAVADIESGEILKMQLGE